MLYYGKIETKRMSDDYLYEVTDMYLDKEKFDCWSYDTRLNHRIKYHNNNDGMALIQIATLEEPWCGGNVIENDTYTVKANDNYFKERV